MKYFTLTNNIINNNFIQENKLLVLVTDVGL